MALCIAEYLLLKTASSTRAKTIYHLLRWEQAAKSLNEDGVVDCCRSHTNLGGVHTNTCSRVPYSGMDHFLSCRVPKILQ